MSHFKSSKPLKCKIRCHYPRCFNFIAMFICFAQFVAPARLVRADTFGAGDYQFEIDFVTIGNPGNAASTFGMPSNAGTVDYVYRVGKYEISREMVEKANTDGGLKISLHNMSGVDGGARADMPAAGVSWNEAARFVNWMNESVGSPHAYKFDRQPSHERYFSSQPIQLWEEGDAGFDPDNPFRNSQARYFLPSVDEWFKAAFYDPNKDDGVGGYWKYPTGSDTAPAPASSGTDPETAVYGFPQSQGPADIKQAGGLSPYGVMAMGGNIFEWMETNSSRDTSNSRATRQTRGNNWFFAGKNELAATSPRHDVDASATGANGLLGFRVAGVILSNPLDLNDDSLVTSTDLDLACAAKGDLAPYLDALNSLPADLDFNGKVDFGDFLILSGNFGVTNASYTDGDINCDDAVNFNDFLLISGAFGNNVVASQTTASVPEPSVAFLFVPGLLAVSQLRRRRTTGPARSNY